MTAFELWIFGVRSIHSTYWALTIRLIVSEQISVVKQLSRCLKRRTSVNHLYHAAMLMMAPSEDQVYDQLIEVSPDTDRRRSPSSLFLFHLQNIWHLKFCQPKQ